MNKKFIIYFFCVMFCVLLSGCGDSKELKEYKTQVNQFCDTIAAIDTSINNIDASAEDSVDILLGYLDELDVSFQEFSALKIPDEFDYLEELAVQSGEYMTEAVALYHEAFSNDSYNEYTASYAVENYNRAFKRVKYIITFLHGETPEDEAVTVEFSDEEE